MMMMMMMVMMMNTPCIVFEYMDLGDLVTLLRNDNPANLQARRSRVIRLVSNVSFSLLHNHAFAGWESCDDHYYAPPARRGH